MAEAKNKLEKYTIRELLDIMAGFDTVITRSENTYRGYGNTIANGYDVEKALVTEFIKKKEEVYNTLVQRLKEIV